MNKATPAGWPFSFGFVVLLPLQRAHVTADAPQVQEGGVEGVPACRNGEHRSPPKQDIPSHPCQTSPHPPTLSPPWQKAYKQFSQPPCHTTRTTPTLTLQSRKIFSLTDETTCQGLHTNPALAGFVLLWGIPATPKAFLLESAVSSQ